MTKKGNNEGSIRRRPNGTWEGRYTDGVNEEGKQIQRSVYGKTKKEVADKLHTIFYQKQQGVYVTPTKVLVKDWLIDWLHNYAHITVRPSTFVECRQNKIILNFQISIRRIIQYYSSF